MAQLIVEDVVTDQGAVAVAAVGCQDSRAAHGVPGICATGVRQVKLQSEKIRMRW